MIVLEWLSLTISPCDAAELWQLGSQDAATPIMQRIIDLRYDIFFFLILILVFVLWISRGSIILKMEGSPPRLTFPSASSSSSIPNANKNGKRKKDAEPESDRRRVHYETLVDGKLHSLIKDLRSIHEWVYPRPATQPHFIRWKKALLTKLGEGLTPEEMFEKLGSIHSELFDKDNHFRDGDSLETFHELLSILKSIKKN